MFTIIILLIVIKSTISLITYYNSSLNYTNFCIINVNEINVENFFQYIFDTEKEYHFTKREKIPLSLLNISYTGCDISNNNTIVKIIFYEDSVEQFHKIIQLFDIIELKYLDDFYNLVKGEYMNVKDFWEFYFGVTTDPDRYIIRDNSSNIYLSGDNRTQVPIDTLQTQMTNLLGNILSSISPNYKTNRTLRVSYGYENVPDNLYFHINRNIARMKSQNMTIQKRLELYRNQTNTNDYSFFDYSSDTIGRWFGIYNYDGNGKRRLKFIDDIFYPLLNKISNNATFLDNIINKVFIGFKELSFDQIKLHSLIYYIYNGVTSNKKWNILKSSFYDLFYSQRTDYNWKKLKVFFSHPMGIKSFRFEKIDKMQKRVRKMNKLTLSINYFYGHTSYHLKNTNYLRFKHPYEHLMDYDETEKMIYLNNNYKKYKKYKSYKSYNLPPFGSSNITWIYHPADVFDINFWNPKSAWFTGFAPGDRNKLRPLWVLHANIPLIVTFIPIPADMFSFVSWVWNYGLRTNLTLIFIPTLKDQIVLEDEMACLPAPPYLPDPRYGCHYPIVEFLPPTFPPENITEMTSLTLCRPWFWPWQQFEGILQLIITPLVKTWVLPTNPSILQIFNFIDSIPIIGIKLYNDVSGLPGTDALPLGLWQCLLAKMPVIVLTIILILLANWLFLKILIKNFRIAIAENNDSSVGNDIDEIKKQDFINSRTLQISLLLQLKSMQNSNLLMKERKLKTDSQFDSLKRDISILKGVANVGVDNENNKDNNNKELFEKFKKNYKVKN